MLTARLDNDGRLSAYFTFLECSKHVADGDHITTTSMICPSKEESRKFRSRVFCTLPVSIQARLIKLSKAEQSCAQLTCQTLSVNILVPCLTKYQGSVLVAYVKVGSQPGKPNF